MAISYFEICASAFQSLKKRKWPYLTYFSSKRKNKTTLFSATFKAKQNKVVLVFQFELKWVRYSHIMFWNLCFCTSKALKRENGHILLILGQNEKNNTTLFSLTLKVGENNVVLFFHFELKLARYGHFIFFKLLKCRSSNFKT